MIINSEEFFQDPGRTMNQIFSFIGLQQLPEGTLHSITFAVFNRGHYDTDLDEGNRKLIQKLCTIHEEALGVVKLACYLVISSATYIHQIHFIAPTLSHQHLCME